MEGCQDLALGDGLAAADHAAVGGLLLDKRCLFLCGKLLEADVAAAVLVVSLFCAQNTALLQDGNSFLRNRRGSGQAGALHAGQIDPAGCLRLLANDKIVHVQIGAHACKAADGLAEVDTGHTALGSGLDKFQTAAGAGGVVALHRLCVGADDQVAVHGGRHQNALAQRVGTLEDNVTHAGALALVQQIVLAPGGDDVEVGGLHHGVYFVCPDTGSVDDAAGLHRAAGHGQAVAALDGFGIGHFAAAAQLHAIAYCHLGHGQCILPRVHDGGAGCPQCTADLLGEVGLHGKGLFPGKNLHVGHAVCGAVLEQMLQMGQFLLVQCQHQRAALLIGDIQLCADLLCQSHAAHVQPCHAGAGGGVVACVENGAVGLGGAVCHIVLGLKNDHLVVVARQCVGGSGTDDATADDCYIIHCSFPPVHSALARRELGSC